MTLVLDDSSCLPAHALYLQHASPVFKDALSGLSGQHRDFQGTSCFIKQESNDQLPAKRAKCQLRLPLPGTSRRQAVLLLCLLYAWDKGSFLMTLKPAELVELARVAHKFCCVPALQQVDSQLVRVCQGGAGSEGTSAKSKALKLDEEVWLTVGEAPAQLQLAADLHLACYEAHVASFIGEHAHAIDLEALDSRMAAVLRGARKIRR